MPSLLSNPPPHAAPPTPSSAPRGSANVLGRWLRGNPLARRILTRPLWWWERQRPRQHPIRERVFELPPLERPAPPADAPTLAVLTTPGAALADAAWTARSLLVELSTPLRLLLVVDGSDADAAEARRRCGPLFPGATEVATTRGLIAAAGLDDAARFPGLAGYAGRWPMGRKLGITLALQERGPVLYTDNDILALAPLPELDAALAAADAPVYLQDVGPTNSEPLVAARAASLGWEGLASLNAGFLFVPRGALAAADAEAMLGGLDMEKMTWFGDTVVLSALLRRAGARGLPRERYVVSTARQFYFEPEVDYGTVALRHFVTTVRHRLYDHAMPLLWKRWTAAAADARS